MNINHIFRIMRSCMPLIAFVICYTPRVGAYCFYNRSGIPEIHVLVFPDRGAMKSYLEATKFTDEAVDDLVELSKKAGSLLLKSRTGIDISSGINALGDKYKYINVNYWLGQLLDVIYDNTMRKAYHVIKNGDKSCWNWESIRKQTGSKRKTFMFLVLDPRDDAKNKVLFTGDLNICAGLAFDGVGKVYQTLPFIGAKGKIEWLPYAEGKKRGYKVAGYVGIQ